MPLEILRKARRVLAAISRSTIRPVLRQAHELLAPVVGVAALVVVPRLGDPYLEKIGIGEQRGSGGIAAAGMTVDPGALDIDPWVGLRQLLHRGDLIRQRVVPHVAI